MYVAGPTIGRIRLGQQLRPRREAKGITRAAAAHAIGRTDSHVRHIETGRTAPSKTELIVLVQLYEIGGDLLAELEDLRTEASKRGWWSIYGLPETAAVYVGLESDATDVRCVEHVNIPGLLQSESYMRRQFELRKLTAKIADKRTGARVRRQDRLSGEPEPLRLSAVISEAVLHRCARDPVVGPAQFDQLLDRATWPNIEVRVLPFDLGMHAGMEGSFSLLSFPEGLLADVAYPENVSGGHLVDDPPSVTRLAMLFDELRSQALAPEESLAMIAQLGEHTRKN